MLFNERVFQRGQGGGLALALLVYSSRVLACELLAALSTNQVSIIAHGIRCYGTGICALVGHTIIVFQRKLIFLTNEQDKLN